MIKSHMIKPHDNIVPKCVCCGMQLKLRPDGDYICDNKGGCGCYFARETIEKFEEVLP